MDPVRRDRTRTSVQISNLDGIHPWITECTRKKTPLSLDETHNQVVDYVHRHNTVRLDSTIGYVTPMDKLEERDKAILAERDRVLRKRNPPGIAGGVDNGVWSEVRKSSHHPTDLFIQT